MGLIARLDELDRVLGVDPLTLRHNPSRRSLLWKGGYVVLVLLAAVVVSGWNGVQDRRLADALGQHGVEVNGEVVELRNRGRMLEVALGDAVKTRFQTADGRAVETWVPVSALVPKGAAVVVYLPEDPEAARLARDPAPRRIDALIGLSAYVFCLLVGVGLFAACRAMDRALGLRA